jgi:hypothetical protein
MKSYKMRSLTVKNGKQAFKDLDLEFEGTRAYVVWDSVSVGSYQLKARLEIDPALLRKGGGRGCDYVYHGALVLPLPELN